MARALCLMFAACSAGCSVQNPYALFGPAKVPAPASAEVAPYYPSSIAAVPKRDAHEAPIATRPSISVASPATPGFPPSSNQAQTEEPIRIAELPVAERKQSRSSPPGNQLPNAPTQQPAPLPPKASHFRRDPGVVPASSTTAIPGISESTEATGQWRKR